MPHTEQAQKKIEKVSSAGMSSCKVCLRPIEKNESCIKIAMSPARTCYIHDKCVSNKILAAFEAAADKQQGAEPFNQSFLFPKMEQDSYSGLELHVRSGSRAVQCFCCGKAINKPELHLHFTMYHSRAYSHYGCLKKLVIGGRETRRKSLATTI